jgi:MFS family permease
MNIQKKYVSKIQNKFFYGWLIVLISALTAFFSAPGQTYFISGFIEFYIEAFDLTRTTVSQYYSLATLSAGLMLPFVGRFIDNHGERRLTLVIATLLSLVCIFTGLMFSPFLLIISFFLLRLLGQGSMTLLSNVVVPKWFYKKRGFALSMITVGSVVGSIFIPPLNTLISLKFGWRMSWYIWSALIAFIFIPIVYLFLINKPEDVGLLIDDEGVEDQERAEAEQDPVIFAHQRRADADHDAAQHDHISSFRMTMMVIASSISPLLIGVLYDRFKGYTEALILMAFIAGLAGLLAIVAKKPKAPEAI